MNKDVLLGSHIGLSGPDYFLGAVKEALSYGENCFMFYTGAPQNTLRKEVSALKPEEGKKAWLDAGNSLSSIIVHAPYIINLASKLKPESYAFSKQFLAQELQRAAAFGADKLVLHPGSDMKRGPEIGIANLVEALDEVLDNDDSSVKIAIETMAGKGTEIGRSFEEVAKILSLVKHKDRVGVTLDTCHVHDAGYDTSNPSAVIDEFDRVIGLDKLLVIHLNDSKNPLGSHKDRHENLGKGDIGFEALSCFVYDPRLANIPKILETPYYNSKPPYKKEIEMLREGYFDPDYLSKL